MTSSLDISLKKNSPHGVARVVIGSISSASFGFSFVFNCCLGFFSPVVGSISDSSSFSFILASPTFLFLALLLGFLTFSVESFIGVSKVFGKCLALSSGFSFGGGLVLSLFMGVSKFFGSGLPLSSCFLSFAAVASSLVFSFGAGLSLSSCFKLSSSSPPPPLSPWSIPF
uniref:Uncharacterized protein n=1 Tax=Cacopsylla melanoneura TaxID=428564 RepID=A0A8D9ETF0_9HEMI